MFTLQRVKNSSPNRPLLSADAPKRRAVNAHIAKTFAERVDLVRFLKVRPNVLFLFLVAHEAPPTRVAEHGFARRIPTKCRRLASSTRYARRPADRFAFARPAVISIVSTFGAGHFDRFLCLHTLLRKNALQFCKN